MNNLGDLIDQKKDLDEIAIIDDTQTVTYRQLLELIERCYSYLLDEKIQKGDTVAINDFNSVNFVAMFLAILKIGAVALPINQSLPKTTLDYILNDSNSRIIVSGIPENYKNIKLLIEINDKDPAFILYTSGSTGTPKGVIIPHSHKWIINQRAKDSGRRKIIVAAPSYHMNGLSNIEFSLATHSTLVLMKKFDPKVFLSNVLKYKINTITSVPTMLHMILDEVEILEKNNFDHVKHVAMASAPVNRELFSRLKSYFPNAIITNAYGLTEVGPGLFGRHPELPTPDLSVGYPREGVIYRIVNDVLEIKSPSMMLKYNNNKNENLTEDGFFITNDLFEVNENGFYFFNGRKDDMFTCGGHNIYPKEIEKIIEEYPGVDLAIVLGIEDLYKGSKPYAFIMTKVNIDLLDLQKFLSDRLPVYSCPREIWIEDHIPLNQVNKIDKEKLKKEARSRINNHS